MKEYFVKNSISKKLKEMGFDVPCLSFFKLVNGQNHSSWLNCYNDVIRDYNRIDNTIMSRPTIQMAIAWLEQKHHIYVMVAPYQPGKWKVCLVYTNDPHPDDGKLCLCELDGIHNSYPDAANFGLMSAIEIVSKVLKAKGGDQ